MNYPVWELEMGGGLLIAIVSVIHVFVSHFAIGGGLFLVLTEHYAYRKEDGRLRDYLVTHSRFFALLTLVFGAITGVGIWFTIALVSPAATSSLIRIFVFGWATEWVFFFVEIAAALVYYRTWESVSRRTHLAVGWVYFVSAFLSLIVINGILTFMLTPGAWTETRSFWDGFFNPTYWPSAAARTFICVALAGIYALLTGVRIGERETRGRLVRYAAGWAIIGTLLTIPSLAWYRALLPAGSEELLAGGMPTAAKAFGLIPLFGGITLLLSVVAYVTRHRFRFVLALALALFGLFSFGALEWTREAVRKPFVIYDYMYSNGLRVGEGEKMAAGGGLLATTAWAGAREAKPDAACGEDVFRFACRGCHTMNGYRGVAGPLAGLEAGYIEGLCRNVDKMKYRMPAFPGNRVEALALAEFIAVEAGPAHAAATPEAAFQRRCGFCHTVDGDRPLRGSLEGNGRDDLIELITMIGDLTEEMPLWTGGETEAGLVADHVLTWYESGAGAGEGE